MVIDVKRGEVQWVKFEVKGDEAPSWVHTSKKKKKKMFSNCLVCAMYLIPLFLL